MALDSKWKKFIGGPTEAPSDRVRVTLNRQGIIYMNSNAYALLDRPKALSLYYNPALDAIALEAAAIGRPESFPVIRRKIGSAVMAAPFCVHNRIMVERTERFIKPEMTPDGQMILHLGDTVSVARLGASRNREKKPA